MSDLYTLTNDELPMNRLAQMAMWGYIDEAQKGNGHAHDRLVRASRGAVLGVLEVLRDQGLLRKPLSAASAAAHGTRGGYAAGCRCRFCTEALNIYERARYHYNKTQGHNKVAGQ